MVFIHWGGFFTGYSSSHYLGPEYFMDKNVVLVSFNYRLGVLGERRKFNLNYSELKICNFSFRFLEYL
jgi:carboxylesterase type B